MNEQNLKTIKVKIAGREYPMKVKDSEVQQMEWISRELDQKIKDFQLNYRGRDLQDCIVMTLLTYAVDFYQKDHSGANYDENQVDLQLESINSLLDKMLNS